MRKLFAVLGVTIGLLAGQADGQNRANSPHQKYLERAPLLDSIQAAHGLGARGRTVIECFHHEASFGLEKLAVQNINSVAAQASDSLATTLMNAERACAKTHVRAGLVSNETTLAASRHSAGVAAEAQKLIKLYAAVDSIVQAFNQAIGNINSITGLITDGDADVCLRAMPEDEYATLSEVVDESLERMRRRANPVETLKNLRGVLEESSCGRSILRRAGVGAVLPGSLPGAGMLNACTIEDWRWSYEANEYVTRGGWIEIDGVLGTYAGFDLIHMRAYESVNGERGAYLGNQSGLIDPGGSFSVSIESARPKGRSLSISYSCS